MKRREALEKLTLAFGALAFTPSAWARTEDGTPILLPDPKKKKSLDRPITAITLGAGNRGNVYGDYAVEYPGELDIVGVAEPIEIRRERYMEKHQIKKKHVFNTWEDVFKVEKFADAVIITTPDDLHYGPCMEALKMGYDVLLEKPISPSEQECRDILALATEKKRIVAVCHVLRYAPYFIKLRELIQTGMLGEVVSMQHFEPINHIHMSHSYVRGNWHNSAKGTPIILAKSCHDLDIVKWMLGKSCTHIQAFGSLSWFKESHAPTGSTNRCTDGCAVEKDCPYSALKIYHRDRTYLHHFDLPEDKSRHGEVIMDYLKNSDYGRCVYRMDNDQADHYICNMLFEEGVTASFNMEAFTSYHGRRTRIMGSMGDIVGDMTKFSWYDFRTRETTEWEHGSDSHGGGDWNLVSDWIQAVAHQDESLLTSTIGASIESHVMGFKAEESRKGKQVKVVEV
ncbi:MAG: Gfo/Idh/MocA family oxidoreductase [Saprospiraceae bacterium]|nr:Gfo/Idh/MocA family oxidoreductase [Saprospiraceae bacterium]